MPIEITMPALSPTMTEGKIAKWLKAENDPVKAGDVLCEIETDKATMEVEAVDEGTLSKILVPAGTENVAVNAPIAILTAEGEAPGEAPKPAKAPVAEAVPAAPAPVVTPKPAARAEAPAGVRIFASPLAKRLAKEAGLDLASVSGSGPHGRIVRADIEASLAKGAQANPAPKPATEVAPVAVPGAAAVPQGEARVAALGGNAPYTLQTHTSMRKAIARRLTEAKQTIPHFYLTIDCDIDALLKLRAEINKRDPERKISVNDFIIRASALALEKVPTANASWSDDGVLLWQRADIAVAVAIDGGLITPIIKDAAQKGLAAISAEMKDLAARAKTGKLKLEEFQGGTFSISNLGMFGIREFAAVINPPHGAILAVGAGEQRAVVRDGALAIATLMNCTLSVDHRVVDGAAGAQFLQVFKRLIEDPLSVLL